MCSVLYFNHDNVTLLFAIENPSALPMNARALDTEGDAQVDAGPAGVWLATVTAAGIAWDGQDLLQGTLSFKRPLLRLPTRVQASRGRGRLSV